MLTDAAIKRISKNKGKRQHIADTGGLYLIINAKGKMTWASRYSGPNGKRCWRQIGDYPTLSLAEARKKNGEIQESASKGADPKNNLGPHSPLEDIYKKFIPERDPDASPFNLPDFGWDKKSPVRLGGVSMIDRA